MVILLEDVQSPDAQEPEPSPSSDEDREKPRSRGPAHLDASPPTAKKKRSPRAKARQKSKSAAGPLPKAQAAEAHDVPESVPVPAAAPGERGAEPGNPAEPLAGASAETDAIEDMQGLSDLAAENRIPTPPEAPEGQGESGQEDSAKPETAYESADTQPQPSVVVPETEADAYPPLSARERLERISKNPIFRRVVIDLAIFVAVVMLVFVLTGGGSQGKRGAPAAVGLVPATSTSSTSASTSTSTSLSSSTVATTLTTTSSTTTAPPAAAQSAVTFVGSNSIVITTLCSVYTTAHNVIFLLGLVLLVFGAAMYAIGPSMPGSLKNQFQGYGLNIVTGGVTGVTIAVVVPYFLQLIASGALPVASCV